MQLHAYFDHLLFSSILSRRSLLAGVYLRNNAYARMYFLVYVTLLHAWLLVVISFKVRERQHEKMSRSLDGYSHAFYFLFLFLISLRSFSSSYVTCS